MPRNQFTPMLAAHAPEDLESLRYPLFASAKLDGIRCLVVSKDWYLTKVGWPEKPYDQGLVSATKHTLAISRTLKPIPNAAIQAEMDHPSLEGLDGELIVGSPSASNVYQVTESGVMSRDGYPNFNFFAFDNWQRGITPYAEARLEWLKRDYPTLCIRHHHERVDTVQDLESFEQEILSAGFEGTMIRDISGPYKHGRATAKQGWLLKLKRFVDGEALILGMEEKLQNANELVYDERGYAKRSSHQDNKIPTGMLGALLVRDVVSGVEFSIGTGFDDRQRSYFWGNSTVVVGKIVKYKSFPHGVKDRPRHPVFLGFRSEVDL